MALKRNLAWMAVGQVTFFVVQFGGTVVLARILTPFEMGVYAVAAAIVGVLSLMQAFGLGSYIVREKSLSEEQIATVFTVNGLISAALSSAVLVASAGASHWVKSPGVGQVLAALAILPLIGIFQLVPYAQLERAGRFKFLVMVNMTRQLTATACTIGFAVTGHSYLSLAYGQVLGGLASAVVLNVVGREYIHLRPSLRGWRQVLVFGGQMIAVAGANALAGRSFELAMARIAGLSALGLFNRASTLFTLFWDNLHLIIGRVLFVDLAARKREGQSLREPYLMIIEVVTAALWPAFAGLAVLAQPLFLLVYGERWLPAAAPFALLALSAVAHTSISMTWELFVVSGETRRQMRIELLRTVLGVAIFAAACFVSLTAAAGARLLDALYSLLLYRPHIERMTDTRLRDMLPIYARSGGLTLAAIAPASALMLAHGGSPLVPVWQVFASIGLGVALWGLALVGMRHPLFREGVKALDRLRRRGAAA